MVIGTQQKGRKTHCTVYSHEIRGHMYSIVIGGSYITELLQLLALSIINFDYLWVTYIPIVGEVQLGPQLAYSLQLIRHLFSLHASCPMGSKFQRIFVRTCTLSAAMRLRAAVWIAVSEEKVRSEAPWLPS